MRKESLITGEYYHIYNRGVDKRDIFINQADVSRFKESMVEFNQLQALGGIREIRGLSSAGKTLKKEPIVSIVAFCLNPNHIHFILKQTSENGISKFMQKLVGGYTYYFNKKYGRSGSLLQGTFKSKLISNENYLRKIFPYVNQNYLMHEIPPRKRKLVFSSEEEYKNQNFIYTFNPEGKEMLKIFGGLNNLKKHSSEIISILRKQRGKDVDDTAEV